MTMLLMIITTTMLKSLFCCTFYCVKNGVNPLLFWLLLLFENHNNDQQQQQNETTVQKHGKKSVFDTLFLLANLTNSLSRPHQRLSLCDKEGHWCGGLEPQVTLDNKKSASKHSVLPCCCAWFFFVSPITSVMFVHTFHFDESFPS